MKCPKCEGTGDARGKNAHEREWIGCETCGGSGEVTEPQRVQWLLDELADRSIASRNLEILPGHGDEEKLRWNDEVEGICCYSIPKGFTPRQALYFVYLWQYGREVGELNGREKLAQELRDLLGVAKHE